jgi:hypothetical protein
MADTEHFWLFVWMGIVLVGLIIFVFFVVGRVAIAIAIDAVRSKRWKRVRKKSVEIPGVGVMTCNPRWKIWSAELETPQIRISLDGTEEAPDEDLVVELTEALKNLPTLVNEAQSFILASEDVKSLGLIESREKLSLESLYLWKENPGSIATTAMEFAHADDGNGVFRVAFENGKPVTVGYED